MLISRDAEANDRCLRRGIGHGRNTVAPIVWVFGADQQALGITRSDTGELAR